ncbi:MAG: type transport system ATP-binding protein [Gaiellaceae bacterium]|nr:type transport system ATP-binding protein [Gaiellaceae bacterium]
MTDGDWLLRAHGIARRFGAAHALEPTDVELRAGETVALIGPNGAGKSTLLSLLAGALPPSKGTLERRPGLRSGWLPQRPGHYARLTPRENLELFARLHGDGDPSGVATAALERFGLPDSGKTTGALSVGNRQRLSLAIALLGAPELLLLDEPTAALDPQQRDLLWEVALEHTRAGGTLVFATQQHEEISHAERVIELREGKVVT